MDELDQSGASRPEATDGKLAWSPPVLERLSMRSAETSNIVFRTNDGATNYS